MYHFSDSELFWGETSIYLYVLYQKQGIGVLRSLEETSHPSSELPNSAVCLLPAVCRSGAVNDVRPLLSSGRMPSLRVAFQNTR